MLSAFTLMPFHEMMIFQKIARRCAKIKIAFHISFYILRRRHLAAAVRRAVAASPCGRGVTGESGRPAHWPRPAESHADTRLNAADERCFSRLDDGGARSGYRPRNFMFDGRVRAAAPPQSAGGEPMPELSGDGCYFRCLSRSRRWRFLDYCERAAFAAVAAKKRGTRLQELAACRDMLTVRYMGFCKGL